MKVFISADIEGVAGIVAWDEATKGKPDYEYFRRQMTAEVAAVCEGAVAAGAQEIVVKDAHALARNVVPGELPECASVSRGWSGHPFCMMDELDSSYDAALMLGYHSRAASGGSPLAHTMAHSIVGKLCINERPASEFHLNAMTAEYVGVPVALVAGDAQLCDDVKTYNPRIATVATQRGHGNSTVSIHPARAVQQLRDGAGAALEGDLRGCRTPLPERFRVTIEYKDAWRAYGRSFYPGARLDDERTVIFETGDYFEVLRLIHFAI